MTTPKTDSRSPEQRQVDELAAAGTWDGFDTESLLTDDAARQLLRRNDIHTQPNGTNAILAMESVRSQPFRWRDKEFRILRCNYKDGHAEVEVAPTDDEFVEELKKRVETDRFHTLTYYQGFGFICFPEDYARYQK
jgi:hypothetical protein